MEDWENNTPGQSFRNEDNNEYLYEDDGEINCPHIDTPNGTLWIDYNILVRYEGTDEELTLPENVHIISASAFSRTATLRKVTLPSSLTRICYGAFYRCTSLEEIVADHIIPVIESNVFDQCISLADADGFIVFQGILQAYLGESTHISVPDHVTGIGIRVFEKNTALETVQCPDTLENIDSRAFYGCTGLRSVDLGRGIRRIGSSAFYGCGQLSELSSLEYVESLGNNAFGGCSELHNLEISDGVSMGNGVFWNCDGLFDSEGYLIMGNRLLQYRGEEQQIRIPEGITAIGTQAFSGCSCLEKAELCEGVKAIGFHAFENCKNLQEVILPESLEFIGADAFLGCPLLEILGWCDYAKVLTHYREIAARGFCRNLLRGMPLDALKPAYFSYIKRQRKRLDLNHIPMLTVMLENGLIPAAEKDLFLKRTDLSEEAMKLLTDYFAELPDPPVKTRRKRSPRTADGLATATELRRLWSTRTLEDGTLELSRYKGEEGAVSVPDHIGKYQITAVGKGCFDRNQDITSVVIPEGIRKIGACAFSQCSGLREVCLPESLREIAFCAFHKCTALKTLQIPSGVTMLGDYLFAANGYIMRGPSGMLDFIRSGESVQILDILLKVRAGSPAQVYAEENYIPYEITD